MTRREDTRRKIQLGGLIIKAGLADEPAAVLLGLLVEASKALKAEKASALRARFKLVGDRVFAQGGPHGTKDG